MILVLSHKYSLFLVTFIRKTHIISHKIPVSEVLFDIFVLSHINILLSFCKNVDITHNVSSNPPTLQKKELLHA